MPKRPPKSGYAQIAQFDQEDGHESRHSNDSDDPFYDNGVTLSLPSDGGIHTQPKSWQSPMHMPEAGTHDGRRPQRLRAHSGVDIKAINARLEKWAEEIKERFTRRRVKGKSTEEEQLEYITPFSKHPKVSGLRPEIP